MAEGRELAELVGGLTALHLGPPRCTALAVPPPCGTKEMTCRYLLSHNTQWRRGASTASLHRPVHRPVRNQRDDTQVS